MSDNEAMIGAKEMTKKIIKEILVHRKPCSVRPETDVLIMDSGGGHYGTITARAWRVLSQTNHSTFLSGYQDSGPAKEWPVVNAVTKVRIQGREDPVLFVMNYVTMLDDDNERESLAVPFQSMKHGVTVDLTPTKYGGTGKMKVDGQEFPFDFDGEKLYYKIEKPTSEDLDLWECFELTSPLPDNELTFILKETRRKRHGMISLWWNGERG